MLKTEWFDSLFKEKLKSKQELLLAFRNQNIEDDWQNYRLCREQLVSLTKRKQEKHSLSVYSLLNTIQQI